LARLFFGVVVNGNLFQILGLENLTAVQAVHVVDPIPPHQELGTFMLTAGHGKQIIPILVPGVCLSSPLLVLVFLRWWGFQFRRGFSLANTILF